MKIVLTNDMAHLPLYIDKQVRQVSVNRSFLDDLALQNIVRILSEIRRFEESLASLSGRTLLEYRIERRAAKSNGEEK